MAQWAPSHGSVDLPGPSGNWKASREALVMSQEGVVMSVKNTDGWHTVRCCKCFKCLVAHWRSSSAMSGLSTCNFQAKCGDCIARDGNKRTKRIVSFDPY